MGTALGSLELIKQKRNIVKASQLNGQFFTPST